MRPGLNDDTLDIIRGGARRVPTRIAAIELETGRRFTYADLDRRIDRCAALLHRDHAPLYGARVAMLSPNTVEMLVVHNAVIRLGGIFVPLNWRLTDHELMGLIDDCTPQVLIAHPDYIARAEAISAASALPLYPLQQLLDGIEGGYEAAYPAARAIDAPATLLYTSGTSGRPKGVVVTERSAYFSTVNFAIAYRVTQDSVFLCDMPMFHIAGLYTLGRVPMLMGGAVAVSAGFNAKKTLDRLTEPELGVSHYFCVTQMARMLREAPGFSAASLSKLTALCTGGAPNPPAIVASWIDNGVRMIDGFGMSESGSAMAMPIDDPELIVRKAGSVGIPLLSVEARVVGDNGVDCAPNIPGELWLRGPNITPGYWNRPEETAKSFTPDGWLRTGDILRRDDEGFYYVVDRKKDMFISGGENVYPAEVEAALLSLPEVVEAAVAGVPDHRWGEVGCAWLVLRDGATFDPSALDRQSSELLARYKVPRHWRALDSLPRNAAGKLQKPQLLASFTPE